MSMVMAGLVGGGLAAAGSVTGALGSSALSWLYSKKASRKQYMYYLQSLRDGPQYQVEGLRKAGLNPLLAVGGGIQNGMGTPVSAPIADFGDVSNDAFENTAKTIAMRNDREVLNQNKNITVGTGLDNKTKDLNNAILSQQLRIERANAQVAEDVSSASQIESNVRELEGLMKLDALGFSVANRDIIPRIDSPAWNHYSKRGYSRDDSGSWRTSVESKRARIDADYHEADEDAYRALMSQLEAEVFSDFLGSAEGRDLLERKIRNQMEQDVFRNSREHQLWEDSINAIHGINEGSSAYEHFNRARRPRSVNVHNYYHK